MGGTEGSGFQGIRNQWLFPRGVAARGEKRESSDRWGFSTGWDRGKTKSFILPILVGGITMASEEKTYRSQGERRSGTLVKRWCGGPVLKASTFLSLKGQTSSLKGGGIERGKDEKREVYL